MPKVMEKDATGRTVQLNGVRITFGDSLKDAKPTKNEPDGKKYHSSNFLLERSHPKFEANKATVIAAMKAVCKEFKRPEDWWKQLFDEDPKQNCFRKGERFKDKEGQVYKGYAENLVIVAKGPKGGQSRPKKMLDRHKRPVEVNDINDVMYNGTYCDAVIAFYATDKGGTARITCSIEAIRSYQEGERLGGGGIDVDADDFEDFEDDDDAFAGAGGTVTSDLDDL